MSINFFDFNTAYISGIYLFLNELNPLEVTSIKLFWPQTLSIFIYLSLNSLRYHSTDLSLNYYRHCAGNLCHVLSRSVASDSFNPINVTCQAPVSMGFSRQEYWGGLPFPSSGNLPNPGIKPRSPELQEDFLLTELQGTGKLWLCIKA